MQTKTEAIEEAARTLAEAARKLRPEVMAAEMRRTDPVLLATMRSVLATCEVHAAALGRLAKIAPEPGHAARLETNVALNVTSMAMCERRAQKVSAELAEPLHRATWTLNAAFSPT